MTPETGARRISSLPLMGIGKPYLVSKWPFRRDFISRAFLMKADTRKAGTKLPSNRIEQHAAESDFLTKDNKGSKEKPHSLLSLRSFCKILLILPSKQFVRENA